MAPSFSRNLAVLAIVLGIGVSVGMNLSNVLSPTPVAASATDHDGDFIMATGLMNDGIEGVFLLDPVTQQLNCTVLRVDAKGSAANLNTFFQRDLAVDFDLKNIKKPKFIMATGLGSIPRGRGPGYGRSVVYVTETSTGKMICYAVPIRPGGGELTLVTGRPMRDMSSLR